MPLQVLQISHDYLGPFRRVCGQFSFIFKDHEVTTTYLCGEPNDDVASATAGTEVLFLNQDRRSMRGLKLGLLKRLLRLSRLNRYDVIVAHRYKSIYLAGLVSLFFPVKLILAVVHEHQVFRRYHRRLFMRLVGRKIVCLAVSDSVKKDIEGHLGRHGSKRVYTLSNGLDESLASNLIERDEARDVLKIPEGAFCFGTVGRLVAKKNHEVLIEGFARAALPKSTCLVIIGSGPREESLHALAVRLGIADRVLFSGDIENAYRYLNAFDFFVFSSGVEEAFGLVLLEAMLADVPLICSEAPGPLEVVGDTAKTFVCGDATSLANVMAGAYSLSPDQRAEMGRAARTRYHDHYTLQIVSEQARHLPPLASLYREGQARWL